MPSSPLGHVDVHAPIRVTTEARRPMPLDRFRIPRKLPLEQADRARVQAALDQAFVQQEALLAQLIEMPTLDEFFRKWSQTYELGLWKGCGSEGEADASMLGRGE
eukprot:12254358-Alexandrium_andersonii.AAC.1